MINTQRTPLFLMANLGSEVARLFHWKAQNDDAMAKNSQERARKIIDEIETFPEMQNRKMEMEILRQTINDRANSTENEFKQKYGATEKHIASYFTPFAERLMTIRN